MDELIYILFLTGLAVFMVNAGVFVVITGLLATSKNGGLKREFIVFFIACSFASILRVVTRLLEGWNAENLQQNIVALAMGMPIAVTGLHLVRYLWRTYQR